MDLGADVAQWGPAGVEDHGSTGRLPLPRKLLCKVLPVGLQSGAANPGPPRSRSSLPPQVSNFPSRPSEGASLVPSRVQISGVELV